MNAASILISPSLTFELSPDINFRHLSHLLADIAPLYPDFSAWLTFKFRRNLASGERNIVIAHDGNQVHGVSLLKSTAEERKICTFYVDEAVRGQGTGRELMNQSLHWLDSDDAIITVSDERLETLQPLLAQTGFQQQAELNDVYRKQHSEFIFSL